jgi:phage gpG-like protein
MIKATVKTLQLLKKMMALSQKLGRLEPVFDQMGQYMVTQSIPANFALGGRPTRWPKVKRQPPTHPLIQSGELFRNACTFEVKPGPVLVVGEAVLGLPYARIQQLGGDTGRGGATHIPPRPSLVAQREDYKQFVSLLVTDLRNA